MRRRSWAHYLPTSLIVGLATLGPLGRKLPAPGSWGSLAGLLWFALFFRAAGVVGSVLACAGIAWLAVGLCGEAEIRLGRRDPGMIILDEFVAMPLCFLGWPALPAAWPAWAIFLGGWILFRFFDIVKPLGIARLQALPGGWGIVLDDSAAALATCATLHVAAWAWAW